jgi:hypothetical protein
VTAVRAPLPAERRRGRLTREKCERFLEALRAGWTVTHAAERAGVHRRRFYEARDDDEAFAAEWSEAWEQGTDRLEDELKRRAFDGYDESTYDGAGELIRRVHRYDNTGLVKLLGARRPEKFRDGATVEVQAPTVFVLESAFARREPIEVVEAEPPLELPAGEVTET